MERALLLLCLLVPCSGWVLPHSLGTPHGRHRHPEGQGWQDQGRGGWDLGRGLGRGLGWCGLRMGNSDSGDRDSGSVTDDNTAVTDYTDARFQLSFRVLSSIDQVSREQWDNLMVGEGALGEIGEGVGEGEVAERLKGVWTVPPTLPDTPTPTDTPVDTNTPINVALATSLRSPACPFLLHDWLRLLEESGCVSGELGWQPLHLVAYMSTGEDGNQKGEPGNDIEGNLGTVVAAMPLYAKYHSRGEFIFDQAWADFAQRALGIKYYPKLLSAVPLTPASGSRVLIDRKIYQKPDEVLAIGRYFGNFMKQLAAGNGIASANVNFVLGDQVPYFSGKGAGAGGGGAGGGYALRETVQYRWTNLNQNTDLPYTDFEDYLSCFKSKRRIKIKNERKRVYGGGTRVEVVPGDSDVFPGNVSRESFFLSMFDLYTTTVEKMWGTQYLSAGFFKLLAASPREFRKNFVFIVAYEGEELVGGTINVVSRTHFYGRYWGAFKYVPQLHFEVCYYKAIEYCIEQGIGFMEPGAGGGEFKFLRGFDPYIVNSLHWFSSKALTDAVGDFLRQEREVNNESAEYMIANSAVGKKPPLPGPED